MIIQQVKPNKVTSKREFLKLSMLLKIQIRHSSFLEKLINTRSETLLLLDLLSCQKMVIVSRVFCQDREKRTLNLRFLNLTQTELK